MKNRGKNCPEKPELNKGPIGMYHCPYCGMMLLAGVPHFEPTIDHPDYILSEEEYKKWQREKKETKSQ